ncbi:histone-like transcription factor [Medicago truncatula]|uniref:Histone-like transcription factor n=1 Tax=Medicago truncatula TaxID=3880 RepID=A0A072U787_MEDTR|nr:histone-like transcription factor [Medicago truncatula]
MDPNQHGRFNDETYVTMAKICELFIEDVTRRAWTKAKQYGGSTIESGRSKSTANDSLILPYGELSLGIAPATEQLEAVRGEGRTTPTKGDNAPGSPLRSHSKESNCQTTNPPHFRQFPNKPSF